MKSRFTTILSILLAAALAFVPAAVLAQQASPGAATTQTGSTGLAGATCLQSTGTSSVALTLTIPAPGGSNSVYLDYLLLAVGSTAAVTTAATVSVFTSTGIAGTPSFPISINSAAAGAVVGAAGATGPLAIPLKGGSGLAVTFVGPAANAGVFDVMTACWHVAP